jgi:predicted Zn-dependent protease with MMP-like domain
MVSCRDHHASHRDRVADVLELTNQEFDEAVADALDEVPADLLDLMNNVVFLVENEPPSDDPDMLGVYEGTPLTQRYEGWAAGSLPDRITIFRGPTLRMCQTREEVLDEVAVTVVHEIAHHFGISDHRLHELGWD